MPFCLNPGHYGSLYDCLLNSMARVQSVDYKEVFAFVVMRMRITLSSWSDELRNDEMSDLSYRSAMECS